MGRVIRVDSTLPVMGSRIGEGMVTMPIGSQPEDARGTVGRPYSALNLRLVLATFGLITCVVLGVFLLWWDLTTWGAVVLAVRVAGVNR